jgi:hypothetical protein
MAAARRRRPGRWVTADGDAVARCRTAIHACQADHVPWWIQDELWEAELAEPVRLVGHKLTSPRGRLVRGVEASDAGATRAFADACAFRARDRAVAALERAGAATAADELRSRVDLEALRSTARALERPLVDPPGWCTSSTSERRPVGRQHAHQRSRTLPPGSVSRSLRSTSRRPSS